MSSFVPATDSVFKKVDKQQTEKEKAENCCFLPILSRTGVGWGNLSLKFMPVLF